MYDWAISAMQTTIDDRGLPDLLREGGRRRPRRERGDAAPRDRQHHRARHHRPALAGARRRGRLRRGTKKCCVGDLHAPRRRRGHRAVLHPDRRPRRSPRCSSCSRSSAPPAASCSTSRCCPTSPARRRSIASPPRATRSGTSAAASCSPSTSRGSSARPGSGCPRGPGLSEAAATLPARLAFVSVAVWWLVFSLPLFRRVPEPPRRLETDESAGENPVRAAFLRLGETLPGAREVPPGLSHAAAPS